jgi:hypothetical protein
MLNIVSRSEQKQVATISYGFDCSAKSAGPYLDMFNPQSPYAEAILAVIAEHLEADHAYVLRLKAHYALIKAVANRSWLTGRMKSKGCSQQMRI